MNVGSVLAEEDFPAGFEALSLCCSALLFMLPDCTFFKEWQGSFYNNHPQPVPPLFVDILGTLRGLRLTLEEDSCVIIQALMPHKCLNTLFTLLGCLI